jgi:hypothetical protein
MIKVIKTSIDYLDPPTSLHMCCHLADLSGKGQLEGDAASQDAVLHALYNTLADHLPSLPAQSIGAVLWSMATVFQQNQDESTSSADSEERSTSEWKAEAIEQVALLEGGCGKVSKYNTKELVNILFSVGALQEQHSTPSKAVVIYSTELMQVLAERMESTPYVKGSLTPSDFTDLVSVCARMFVVTIDNKTNSAMSCPSEEKDKEEKEDRVDHSEAEILPPEAYKLMDLVAGEVRRQLANRSSSRAAFLPRELTRFLKKFASLEMRESSNVDGLFDVISGFVVNRIRSKHLNAVTKPDDLAAVLAAYAQQGHKSVSVPELLTAVGEQLRINAAQMQDIAIAAVSAQEEEDIKQAPPLQGGPPDLSCSFPALISILESHRDLGYAIDPLTLTALLPGIKRNLVRDTSAASSQNVGQLLELFRVFDFDPGPKMKELLVARTTTLL